MKNILVVGIGNFGSWWVLSLSKIKTPAKIYCFDTDQSKYNVLKKRLDNDKSLALNEHKLCFINSISDAQKNLDVIVVSTNADIRLKIIQELRQLYSTKNWIIEKVLVQSSDQLKTLVDCLDKQKVYVNHSRRLQPATKFCKNILDNNAPLKKVRYLGGRWELLSNSFHFIDLFSYWFDAELIKIDTTELNNHWHPSATRHGFFDVRGILKVKFNNNIELIMDWSKDNNDSTWIFDYVDEEIKYHELSGEIFKNNILLKSMPLLKFSEMGQFLEPILIGNNKSEKILPQLIEVKKSTSLLLDAFLNHWRVSNDKESQIVPIS
ncbi:hypothetical protein [Candidatus Pelagibacter sp. HIMB1485]|uniref:hypothetical protein n=1 Tax=Candidatus Pelagibacter sp. HIMB1485 TaxID=3415415 RepID=UPI003F8461DF